MKRDKTEQILLILCTSVIVLAGLYFARAIVAPVAFSLFVIAIAWPLQRALQVRIPKLLAVAVTIIVTIAVIAVLGFLVVWGLGLVIQWLVANTDRLQLLYLQAPNGSTAMAYQLQGW